MTAPSLIDLAVADVEPFGTRSADFCDEDVLALAGWLAELPHLERILIELQHRIPQAFPAVAHRGVEIDSAPRHGRSVELEAAQAEVAQLRSALVSNREIAAACGILMSRHRVKQIEAFHLLEHASQTLHRKLHAVALDVLDTGELPERADP